MGIYSPLCSASLCRGLALQFAACSLRLVAQCSACSSATVQISLTKLSKLTTASGPAGAQCTGEEAEVHDSRTRRITTSNTRQGKVSSRATSGLACCLRLVACGFRFPSRLIPHRRRPEPNDGTGEGKNSWRSSGKVKTGNGKRLLRKQPEPKEGSGEGKAPGSPAGNGKTGDGKRLLTPIPPHPA